jgi:CheY-like chemotaxis protein
MNLKDPQAPYTQEESVLIIDDDQEIRGILQERLKIEGLSSVSAPSGEEGLSLFLSRLAKEAPFQTLILDIRMKGISGIELLKLIRLIDQRSTILMISGLGDLSKAVLCLRHGADDYLSKPIKIWDLKARLATAQGRRKAITHRQGGETKKGLQWGTAFVPQIPQEFTSVLNTATSIPGDKNPEGSKQHGSGEGTQDASKPDQCPNNKEELLKSPDPQSDPGVLETRKERKGQKGRKGESLHETPEHGKGENRAKAARESGTLRSGPKKKAPQEPTDSAVHPGEEADLRAASPLDVFFFLIDQLESQEMGWAGHSQRLSQFISKAAALFMRELDLEPVDLNALRLAGLVHNLGLIRAHGALGHGFASPAHASSSIQKVDHSLLEDLALPARVLEGLLPLLETSLRSTAETAKTTLEQAGRIRRQLHEFGSILETTKEKKEKETEKNNNKAETLGLFFELTDLCFHAQKQNKENSSSKLPLGPYLPAIEAYASKIGFPIETILDGLSRLLNLDYS